MSTGMERGGRGCEGVDMPGVAGGVKAGEMIEGGGRVRASLASSSDVSMLSAAGVWKSKPSRAALERWGEKCGGNAVMAVRDFWGRGGKDESAAIKSTGAWTGGNRTGDGPMCCGGFVDSLMTCSEAARVSLFRNRAGS